MPTIIRKPRNRLPKPKEKLHGSKKEVSEIYNNSKWRKLRNAYLMEHPLCEMCLEEGRTTPTEEIHHIKPILSASSQLEREELAYDPDNLMALCKECHHKIHNDMRSVSVRNKRKY